MSDSHILDSIENVDPNEREKPSFVNNSEVINAVPVSQMHVTAPESMDPHQATTSPAKVHSLVSNISFTLDEHHNQVLPSELCFPLGQTVVSLLNESCVGADVPPLPSDFPLSSSELIKLQKRRIHNERVRNALISEMEAFENILKEEENLRKKCSKTVHTIQMLTDKSLVLEGNCKSVEELYRLNTEKLKVLQHNLCKVLKQIEAESVEVQNMSSKLHKLKAQKVKLEPELLEITNECATLTNDLSEALSERAKVNDLLSRIKKETMEVKSTTSIADCATQTIVSFTVYEEVRKMQAEIHKQLSTMKNVRESIELIKRCT